MGFLLYRGMLVGLLAGFIAFGFARIYGEPSVEAAIAFEEQQAELEHAASHMSDETMASANMVGENISGEAVVSSGHSHGGEEELVSRSTQKGLGLFVATSVFGAAIGGIFAVVCGFAFGRFGPLGVKATSLLLALSAFVSVVLVPQMKYPANPPAVGNPDTIIGRTELYFGLVVISLLAMILSYIFAQKMVAKFGCMNAAIFAGLGYLVFMGIIYLILPVINEVPENFSASVLWDFRISTLAMQAILWGIIGVAFGFVVEKRMKIRA